MVHDNNGFYIYVSDLIPWWKEEIQLTNEYEGSLAYLYKEPCVSIYWHL
jgi:hypothetical protein